MKYIFSLCLLVLIFSFCFAQSSREFHVKFSSTRSETPENRTYRVEEFPETPFTSLSAYVLEPGITTRLYYRIQARGEWTPWQSMLPNQEGETPDRTTFHAPYIDGSFEALQFRASETLDKEVVFRLFFPAFSQNTEGKMKAANDSICSCQKPSFCDHNCWCPSGDCPKDSTPAYTTPSHIIIHHSAGSSVSNNWPAVVTAIWDLHVKTNGWDDVGYNWLIDPNGVIYEGRGDSVLGAHFSCMNSGTTGICMLGNFETAQPTFNMISSLSYLIAWEACMENIPPLETRWHASSQLNLPSISSHRDGNTSTAPNGCPKGTLCPGANLYAMLPAIRQAVASNPCTGSLNISEAFKNGVHLYPNPADDQLGIHQQLAWAEPMKAIEIRNTGGQLVQCVKVGSNTGEVFVNIRELAPGLYFLTLLSEQEPLTFTFVKN